MYRSDEEKAMERLFELRAAHLREADEVFSGLSVPYGRHVAMRYVAVLSPLLFLGLPWLNGTMRSVPIDHARSSTFWLMGIGALGLSLLYLLSIFAVFYIAARLFLWWRLRRYLSLGGDVYRDLARLGQTPSDWIKARTREASFSGAVGGLLVILLGWVALVQTSVGFAPFCPELLGRGPMGPFELCFLFSAFASSWLVYELREARIKQSFTPAETEFHLLELALVMSVIFTVGYLLARACHGPAVPGAEAYYTLNAIVFISLGTALAAVMNSILSWLDRPTEQ